jgi:hypothetical protein
MSTALKEPPQPDRSEWDETYDMMDVMLQLDFPPLMADDLLQVQHDMMGVPHFKADDRRFFTGPIVFHSRERRDPYHPANRWKGHIYAERFRYCIGRSPFRVGPAELAAVLYNASLENPLGYALSEIYKWAAAGAIKAAQGGNNPFKPADPALWRLPTDSIRVKTDEEILADHQIRSAYNALSAEVRRKVINCSKALAKNRPADEVQLQPERLF